MNTAVSAINKPVQMMNSKLSQEISLPNISLSKQALSVLRSKHQVSITDIDALELARQLTLIDSKQFCAIQPYELIGLQWTKKEARVAINVKNMSALSVDISTWVAAQIVYESDVKKRAAVLKHFIKIADVC